MNEKRARTKDVDAMNRNISILDAILKTPS